MPPLWGHRGRASKNCPKLKSGKFHTHWDDAIAPTHRFETLFLGKVYRELFKEMV